MFGSFLKALLEGRRRRLLRQRRWSPNYGPACESLEGRKLLSASATFAPSSGVLTVTGDAQSNTLVVGRDAAGPWLGFQAWRPTFDALLLARARELDVAVVQPCPGVQPVVAGRHLVGVDTPLGSFRAPITVDATGRRRAASPCVRMFSCLSSIYR